MVLIDAVHEDAWGGREQALLPPETPDEQAAVLEWRQWLTTGLYAWDTLPEYLDAMASVAEGRTCGLLGDRPLVVLRAGNYGAPPDFPQDIAAAIEQLRQEIHSSFTRLSSHSSYIVAERSGHIVQYDEPELVLDAIRGVVDTLRAGRREAEDAEE
jgi:pimeloyl-ACP methyl ester carboxylesterase